MSNRSRWSGLIRRNFFKLFGIVTPKLRSAKPKRVGIEHLEDRTVPYSPALGFGQATGFPLQSPGPITLTLAYGDVNLDGNFYESVNAASAFGNLIQSTTGANVYNTEGPVITLGGGDLKLGSGITFGRASSFVGTITPGNEILVNGVGGQLTATTGDSLNNLNLDVRTDAQLLLGDVALPGAFNSFSNTYTLAGAGFSGAGAVQGISGINVGFGSILSTGSITVGASTGATLILNGPVNGVRSDTAFSSFSTTGGGTVILDNVFPVPTVTATTPTTTNNPAITFRVSLSEKPQTDLVLGSLTVVGGTVNSFIKIDDLTYDYSVTSNTGPGGFGTVTASVASGLFIDKAYLSNVASNVASVTVDRQPPTASGTFTDIDVSMAAASQATINITYTDGAGVGIDPSTINAGNITVETNAPGTLTVAPNPTFNPATGVATYTILSGSTWGQLTSISALIATVKVNAGTVADNLGNTIEAATLGTFDINTHTPVLTVNNGLPIPPSNGPNTFTVNSSEPILTLDPSKFTATNGAVTSVTLDPLDPTNKTIIVTVTPTVGLTQANVTLQIAQGAVTDSAHNPSLAVTPSSGFIYDTLLPIAQNYTFPLTNVNAGNAGGPVGVDFRLTDPKFGNVFGSGVDILTVTNSIVDVRDPLGNQVAVSGIFFDPTDGYGYVDVQPIGGWAAAPQGLYTVTLKNFKDYAGNTGADFALGSFYVAVTAPAVSLTAVPNTNIPGVSTVTMTFTTASSPLNDIAVSDPTLASLVIVGGGTASNLVKVGPNVYTFDITPATPTASVTVQLPSSSVSDQAGNLNSASNTLSLDFNVASPIPSINFTSTTPTSDVIITGSVVFSEAVTLDSTLLQLSLSDFNITSGSVVSFSATDTTDGITFPFSITVSNADQTLTANVKAAIAKAVAGANLANLAGSPSNMQVVVTDPVGSIVAPIAPVNSTISAPNAKVPFQVKFTTGSGIPMDFSNPADLINAITITGAGGPLTFSVDPVITPDPVTGIVSYLIDAPATIDGWFDAAFQGSYTVTLNGGILKDIAGNTAGGALLNTFQIATAQPGAYLTSPEMDASSQWINDKLLAITTVPGQVAVRVYATDANGGLLTPTSTVQLNTTIVPNATNFSASAFTVQSVSNAWVSDPALGNAWYITVSLAPAADVVGDTFSVGPASIVVNPNSYFDTNGNGNAAIDPNNLVNSIGFLSFTGIDRVAPIYSTAGALPNKINGSQLTAPVNVTISYADATAGLDNGSLSPNNVVLLLNGVPYTDVTVTGAVDPGDQNLYTYTFTPTSTWANGSYTFTFTSNPLDQVYDLAQSQQFDVQSANGIAPGLILSGGTPIGFGVDGTAPTVGSAVISGSSPTNVSPLSATVTFSEPVQGFTAGNLSFLNAVLGVGGVSTVDNQTFTFQLIPTTSNGLVSFTVLPAGVTDFYGNALAVGATSNAIQFNELGPIGTLVQAPQNFNSVNGSGSTNTFSVQFPVGIDPTTISVKNYDVDNGATITGVSYDPLTRIATYTITAPGASWNVSNAVYTLTGATDVANQVKDTLGNPGTVPSTSFVVDTLVPTVTAAFDQSSPTNLSVLTVTLTFSRPVTFITADPDFSNLFTVTNGTVAGYTQLTPTTFTVNVNPLLDPEGERIVTLTVVAGAALDDAGNPNTVSNVASIQFDNLGPVLTVTPTTLVNNETAQQTITVNVVMSPAGEYQFQNQPLAGIVLANATYVPGSFTPTSGINGSYSFQITATNPGLVQVGFGKGAFVDAQGNGSLETVVNYFYRDTLTETISSPDVTQGGTTALTTLNFVTVFDRDIVTFNSDVTQFFTVANATITDLVQDPTNLARFTYKVHPITTGNQVSVQVNAGVATDTLGLSNQASTPFTFDYAAPAVTATLKAGATPVSSLNAVWIELTFSEPVTGIDASNFVSKFTVGGATINASSFKEIVAGTTYGFVINPNAVIGSNDPVAVTLQLKASTVTPANEASNLISYNYVNNPLFIGKGVSSVVTRMNPDNSEVLIQAYAPAYLGGVRVAGANFAGFTGSNTIDLLAVAGTNGQGHVTVFNGQTGTSTPSVSFFAFPGFMGGAFVAAGDVNADGFNDIVVSAGAGGGPNVKVYSGNPADAVNTQTPGLIFSFFAYQSDFTGGATVSVADVNGDGFADVVTGAGPGGGPHVKIFSGKELATQGISLLASFYSGASTVTNGIYVNAGDLRGDGTPEIITGLMAGSTATVNVFTLTPSSGIYSASLLNTFEAYNSNFHGGVTVATVDLGVDNEVALVTGAGPGGGPHLETWQINPGNTFDLIDSVFIGDPLDPQGLFVG